MWVVVVTTWYSTTAAWPSPTNRDDATFPLAGGHSVEFRANVGLLTRNVQVQGTTRGDVGMAVGIYGTFMHEQHGAVHGTG